jgi:hypothetical protein
MFFSNVATKPSFQVQPTLNQRYAATELEQTRPDGSYASMFSVIFRGDLPAHNGLVAGSSPAGTQQPSLAGADYERTTRSAPLRAAVAGSTITFAPTFTRS